MIPAAPTVRGNAPREGHVSHHGEPCAVTVRNTTTSFRVLLFATAAAFAGCATTKTDLVEVVMKRAAYDLKCDAASLTTPVAGSGVSAISYKTP